MNLAYATVADLVRRFGELELVQLTDLDNIPPSMINVAAVQDKIDDASATINGYVGQVYRLPLLGCAKPLSVPGGQVEYVTPPLLVRVACDLVRYYLHDDLAPEHEVYRRFKDAMRDLEKIASGAMQLTCPWGGSPGGVIGADIQSGGNEVWSDFSPRAITDDSLKGFA